MFPQFGATAESLSKASTLVFRFGTDAHLYDDPDDVSIAPLLDSRFDSEKIEALKRLLALIAQGADVSNFFPQVVKNVASQSLEVKKLVYLYLLHYAEKRPNEALLSINCFQKDLSDTNPLVRAWALRTMAGIRLHATGPIVLAAVSKCARDPSAYVRKCAANALPKLHDLRQEENVPTLEELIYLLLSDHSPGVIGAAAAAFSSVCPQKLSLIGRNFRRLCETLPDVEEWGQIILTDVLLRYVVARHGLVQESVMFLSQNSEISQNNQGFEFSHLISSDPVIMDSKESRLKASTGMLKGYIEGPEKFLSFSSHLNINDAEWSDDILTTCQNNDVKLLLQCTSPLLWSQNSAVVLAAAGVHWIMASKEDVKRIVKPLLFILRSSYAARYVALCNIQVFAKATPSLFAPYYEDFFVSPSDSYQIRALKLEILSNIATDSTISSILQEIQDYIKDPDRRFAADSVAAIGLCAQRIPSVAETCIQGLLALIKEECSFNNHTASEMEAGILVQAIMSIKATVSQNPARYEKIVVQLANILDSIKVPLARALIIWIVGEYSYIGQNISRIIPIILKYLVRSFTSEELETKQQILNTAAKVALSAQREDMSIFKRILSYLLQLAKCDINYDVRDRARMMEKLLVYLTRQEEETSSSTSSKKELSQNIVDYIISGKMRSTFPSSVSRVYLPGSLSQVVLHAAPGYEPLPKPCSLLDSDMNAWPDSVQQTNIEEDRTASSYTGSDYSDTVSGSSAEESNCNSQNSTSQDDHDGADFVSDSYDNCISKDHNQNSIKSNQLVHLSDAGSDYIKTRENASDNTSLSFSSELAEFMSRTTLESWLEEKPSLPGPSSSGENPVRQSSLRISLKEIAVNVRPKVYKLLDSVNGNGLRVDYSFSPDISIISPLLIHIELLFENTSTESLRNITIIDVDENEDTVSQTFQTRENQTSVSEIPNIVPVEEIASLDPNEKTTKSMQVRFHHHLLPLKLVVLCGQKKFPVKLKPNIGYFIKPLSLDTEQFLFKELQLRGMFEYTRRCIFKDHVSKVDHKDLSHDHDDRIISTCRTLATKVLGGANLFFVSAEMPVSAPLDDVSGLCLRFSGEIIGNSKPCLLTVIAEGKSNEPLNVLVKINCEETIFCLNFLNSVVALFT